MMRSDRIMETGIYSPSHDRLDGTIMILSACLLDLPTPDFIDGSFEMKATVPTQEHVACAGCYSMSFSMTLNVIQNNFDENFWHCLLDRSLAIEAVTLTEQA